MPRWMKACVTHGRNWSAMCRYAGRGMALPPWQANSCPIWFLSWTAWIFQWSKSMLCARLGSEPPYGLRMIPIIPI